MSEVTWEHVAPYLVREVQSDEAGQARGAQIADFLRNDQQCTHVEWVPRGVGQPGWNNGSCTKISVTFDKDWRPIPEGWRNAARRYMASIGVSERGPFVTSYGYEWSPRRESWDQTEKLYPHACDAATTKAKTLALAVATAFDLTYLDADWLRQFKLSEKDLPDDVLLSLDYSEPDALNVLFDEAL